MKNNLKFRAYNKHAKKYITDDQKNVVIFDLVVWGYYASVNRLENIEHLEIQRFTGLKDKNGKEIFEGDILKMEWTKRGNFIIAEVKYGSGGFYLPKYDFLNVSVKHDEIPDGEVVGNIFENPELLK